MTDVDQADEQDVEQRGGFGSLSSILLLLVLTWAAALASFPLTDNSFFTHLATGRLILDRGSVPDADPYTFTAAGEPWTVQSWLASVAYAGGERLAADVGLRAVVLGVLLVTVMVLWKVTRPARSIIVRLLVMAPALLIGTDLWGERPYMVGVIGVALVWLALEGRLPWWALGPWMWIWVNSHGSWPLAFVLVACILAGRTLDRRAGETSMTVTEAERRTLVAITVGTLLGAVGPLGLRALTFPASALQRSDVFAEILEWQPPVYRSTAERLFLVLVVIVVLLLVSARSWELAIPAAAFSAAGIFAQRNVVMAVVVLTAVLARATPAVGSLRVHDRPPLGQVIGTVLAVVLAATAGLTLLTPAVDERGLGGYPARPLALMGGSSAAAPLGTDLAGGNLLEVLDGADRAVFVDDRVDMFPPEVFDDYLALVRGAPAWEDVLIRYGLDVVVWERAAPLASLLAADPDWRVSYSDEEWVVGCRRGSRCPVS